MTLGKFKDVVTWANLLTVVSLVLLAIGSVYGIVIGRVSDNTSKIQSLSARTENNFGVLYMQNCKLGLMLSYMARDMKITLPPNSFPDCQSNKIDSK